MATNDKVVYLHAEAKRRVSMEKERDRAHRVAGWKYKALCAKDAAVRYLSLSLRESAGSVRSAVIALARTSVQATYRLLRLVCTLGVATCLFFVVRDLLNDFPNGPLGFAFLIGVAAALQCIKLTTGRLLAQARKGSIFDVQRTEL